MSGHHARRSPTPFWALIGALALVAGGMMVASAMTDDGEGAGASSVSPSPSPSGAGKEITSPSRSPGPPPHPKGNIVIHGTGDVSLDPGYISTYASHGYGYAWSGLRGLFRRDDLTVVNVECPVTDEGSQLAKEFSFQGAPFALPAMRDAGVEVGSLANNHAYDRGPEGVVDSRRNLEAAGIAAVGAGKDQEQALEPAMFRLDGWTVAVLGFDEVLDPLDAGPGRTSPERPRGTTSHSWCRP